MKEQFISLLKRTPEFKQQYKSILKEVLFLRKNYFKCKIVKPIMTLCVPRFHPFGEDYPGSLYNPEHINGQDWYICNKVLEYLHQQQLFVFDVENSIFKIGSVEYYFKRNKFRKS